MVLESSGYGVTAHGQHRPYTTLWWWRVTVMVVESNGYGGGE
jgi:hypothetical protein